MNSPIKLLAQCFSDGGKYYPPGSFYGTYGKAHPVVRVYQDGAVVDEVAAKHGRGRKRLSASELNDVASAVAIAAFDRSVAVGILSSYD